MICRVHSIAHEAGTGPTTRSPCEFAQSVSTILRHRHARRWPVHASGRRLLVMSVREQVHALRREIQLVAEAHGASRVRLFGSAARGQETGASDVDLLVALEPGRTLLDLARLETQLVRLLHRNVDVVPESGLREPFRTAVMRDAVDV